MTLAERYPLRGRALLADDLVPVGADLVSVVLEVVENVLRQNGPVSEVSVGSLVTTDQIPVLGIEHVHVDGVEGADGQDSGLFDLRKVLFGDEDGVHDDTFR